MNTLALQSFTDAIVKEAAWRAGPIDAAAAAQKMAPIRAAIKVLKKEFSTLPPGEKRLQVQRTLNNEIQKLNIWRRRAGTIG